MGTALLFSLLIITAYCFRVDKKISLTFLQEHHQNIQTFIEQQYFLSVALYISLFILCIILMLPITILLIIASGYFFGVLPGTIYSILGSVVGSLLSFLIFRYILRDWAIKRYHKKFATIEHDFDQHGVGYILSLLLFPITPFAIVNIIAGLSNIHAWKYICIIIIGITPYTLLLAFTGKKLVDG